MLTFWLLPWPWQHLSADEGGWDILTDVVLCLNQCCSLLPLLKLTAGILLDSCSSRYLGLAILVGPAQWALCSLSSFECSFGWVDGGHVVPSDQGTHIFHCHFQLHHCSWFTMNPLVWAIFFSSGQTNHILYFSVTFELCLQWTNLGRGLLGMKQPMTPSLDIQYICHMQLLKIAQIKWRQGGAPDLLRLPSTWEHLSSVPCLWGKAFSMRRLWDACARCSGAIRVHWHHTGIHWKWLFQA